MKEVEATPGEKKSKAESTLVRYMKNSIMPINIYEFVDRVHNIL